MLIVKLTGQYCTAAAILLYLCDFEEHACQPLASVHAVSAMAVAVLILAWHISGWSSVLLCATCNVSTAAADMLAMCICYTCLCRFACHFTIVAHMTPTKAREDVMDLCAESFLL